MSSFLYVLTIGCCLIFLPHIFYFTFQASFFGPPGICCVIRGLPRWCCGKESTGQCRRCKRLEFDPWAGRFPRNRKWQCTPVFLPGKCHGQRSLAGYSPWGTWSETQLSTRVYIFNCFPTWWLAAFVPLLHHQVFPSWLFCCRALMQSSKHKYTWIGFQALCSAFSDYLCTILRISPSSK